MLKLFRHTDSGRHAAGFPVTLADLKMSGAVDADRPGEIQVKIQDPNVEGVSVTLSMADIAVIQTFAHDMINRFIESIGGAPAPAPVETNRVETPAKSAKVKPSTKPEPTTDEQVDEVEDLMGDEGGEGDVEDLGANGEDAAPPPPEPTARPKAPARPKATTAAKTGTAPRRTRRTRQQMIDDAAKAKEASEQNA